jgi:hypothetical protein
MIQDGKAWVGKDFWTGTPWFTRAALSAEEWVLVAKMARIKGSF